MLMLMLAHPLYTEDLLPTFPSNTHCIHLYLLNSLVLLKIHFNFLSPLPWQRHENMSILSQVSRQPKGAEWLWHPKVVALYKLVLQSSDSNSTGREAAVGALQNITAGETRVSLHCHYCEKNNSFSKVIRRSATASVTFTPLS